VKNSFNFDNNKNQNQMDFTKVIIEITNWKFIFSIVLISLIIIALLGYIVFLRFERKISFLYPRKRNQLETPTFKKVRQEFFKQGKQIEAFKMAITITIDSRNLVRRLSDEMKNIERLYIEFKPIKNSDFEVLEELKSTMDPIPANLENLIITRSEYLNTEFRQLIQSLKQVLSECNTITDKIFSFKPEDIEINFFSTCAKNIESKCQVIKELHDRLIKNFQVKFSKTIQ
jgi:uncharacterized membrane protein YraQ (UPF0718 family)